MIATLVAAETSPKMREQITRAALEIRLDEHLQYAGTAVLFSSGYKDAIDIESTELEGLH